MLKRSEKGLFGTYVHRDENNNIMGTSEPNPLFRKEMIHKVDDHSVLLYSPGFNEMFGGKKE